ALERRGDRRDGGWRHVARGPRPATRRPTPPAVARARVGDRGRKRAAGRRATPGVLAAVTGHPAPALDNARGGAQRDCRLAATARRGGGGAAFGGDRDAVRLVLGSWGSVGARVRRGLGRA